MRDLPSDVLGAVRGGFGNASDGLLGGSSPFSSAIQGELGNFRANSSSGDFLSAIGSRANTNLIGDMAKGISPLSGRGW